MRKIRLLALDLDDTLLRSDLSISYRTRASIKRTEAAGVTVVLASSRVPAAIDRFARLLGLHKRPGYLICGNGAIIQESHTGRVIYEAYIAPGPATAACDLADAEGFAVQIYEDDVMYVSRHNEFTAYDEKLTGLRQVVVENFREMAGQGCSKLLIPGDPMLLQPLETILRAYLGNDTTILPCGPGRYFLEILPQGTSKGAALEKVADLLGIPPEETMAVGASITDEAMLRWAGLGIALANAGDALKNAASGVTSLSNDDEGVVEALDRFLLGKTP